MVRSSVPREFLWNAPVWQADLDAFGELRTTSLLRLLQESATRASDRRRLRRAVLRPHRNDVDHPPHEPRVREPGALRRRPHRPHVDRRLSSCAIAARVRGACRRAVRRARLDRLGLRRPRARSRPRRIPPEWEATFLPDGPRRARADATSRERAATQRDDPRAPHRAP